MRLQPIQSAPLPEPSRDLSANRQVTAAPVPEPAVPASAPAEETTEKRSQVDRAVEKMNETAQLFNHALKFEIGEDRIIIKVIDTNSGEIIRQIPPDELLKAFDRIEESIGSVFDFKV